MDNKESYVRELLNDLHYQNLVAYVLLRNDEIGYNEAFYYVPRRGPVSGMNEAIVIGSKVSSITLNHISNSLNKIYIICLQCAPIEHLQAQISIASMKARLAE